MLANSETLSRAARPTTSRWSPLVVAVAFALAALAAMLVANGLVRGVLFFPPCTLKWLTGIPCPGCGGTRALAAIFHGDWSTALAMNPLVVLGACAAWLGVPLTWFDLRVCRGRGIAAGRSWLRQRWFRWSLAALVLANWAWLWIEGR